MAFRTLTALASLAALSACASYQNEQPFNVWVNEVQRACFNQRIGTYAVDSLIGNPTTSSGNYFLDQVERAFDGRITPQRFASDVAAFLVGNTSDPGIQCVVARIPPPRNPTVY
jgi:hypothetical protein